MYLLKPKNTDVACAKAAEILAEYYKKITGEALILCTEPQEEEDMIVIGSEAVTPYVYEKLPDGLPLRIGTEDYCLLSVEEQNRTLLFLAGGRGRSTLYAVYDFLERRCGCHYFWDGDVIPKQERIDITNLSVKESPRFSYRALRYFAHRGLKRFQAEHWDFEDWKREIDWMCKKRLNTFMLRIGMDDLFQKAFPDVVEYPSNEAPIPEAGPGYDNRTTFWSLQYRGELRKKVMDYAFSCDLMHPEDCGTMTHWYSRTPLQFLEKLNPGFLSQADEAYTEQTGLVWNIFEEENLNRYWKLTETSVKEYGKPELFHTIGLAERTYSEDRQANLNLKKYAYKRIIDHVSRTYPNAPLLVASWDFLGYLEQPEVVELVKMFDPKNTVILDYTVDKKAEYNNFEKWDIMGKIPWIFGMFHAYEPQNHIHGDFEYLNEKLAIASSDGMCKGMALWPEISHCDTLTLEYFTENAWNPQGRSIEEIAMTMCEKRYGTECERMKEIWNAFLPTMKLPSKCYAPYYFNTLHPSSDRHPIWKILQGQPLPKEYEEYWSTQRYRDTLVDENAAELLSLVSELPDSAWEKEFIRRDVTDMIKTVTMKKLQYLYVQGLYDFYDWSQGKDCAESVREKLTKSSELLSLLGDVLGLCDDHSMYHSYCDLEKNRKVNPCFDEAYRENVLNFYCRAAIFEAVKGVYEKEVAVFRAWLFDKLETGTTDVTDTKPLEQAREQIINEFKATPLNVFQQEKITDKNQIMKKLLMFFKN